MGKKYSRTTERNIFKDFFKTVRERMLFSRALLKRIFTKFLSVVCEYFFPIFLKTMNNESGNYAKRLTICLASLRQYYFFNLPTTDLPECYLPRKRSVFLIPCRHRYHHHRQDNKPETERQTLQIDKPSFFWKKVLLAEPELLLSLRSEGMWPEELIVEY